MPSKRIGSTIAYRLLLAVVVFSILVTILASGVHLYINYDYALRAIENDIQHINKSHISSIAASLWVMDRQQLQTQLEGIRNIPNVEYLEIRHKGEVISSEGHILSNRTIHREFPVRYTLGSKDMDMGVLHVYAGLDRVYDDLLGKMLLRLLVQAVEIFFVSVFILFIVRALITKRLFIIADHVSRLETGGLAKQLFLPPPPVFRSEDELDHVARAITSMSTKLEGAFSALETELERRKIAEGALIESEKLYRSLFENMLNGFAYCRMLFKDGTPRDFIYLAVNDAFESQTGLKNVVGKKVTEVIPGIRETDPQLFDVYGRVAMTGKPEQLELYVKALQMWFWISVYSPAQEHFVAVFDVITERKKAEEELKSVTQRLKFATQSARLGVWDWDTVNNIMVWDDRMLELYGLTRETFPGGVEAWQNSLHPEDRDRTIEECQAALRGGKDWDTDFKVLHLDGTVKYIKANGIVIRDSENNPVRMLGINFDITEHRKLEEQLRQSQKMEAIGTLAGGVAHDFNNILQAIIGFGFFALRSAKNNEETKKYIDEMLAGANRAAELTNGLLAFSRKQTISLKQLDLNSIVKKMHAMIVRLIGEDIKLESILANRELPVMVDASQMDQVLLNLVTNARDAMPDGGNLVIKTEGINIGSSYAREHLFDNPGSYAVLSVSDTGTGMDKKTKDNIFEPFFTTKGVGKGTGLGLSMVYGIVKQHSGYINVYSEPGKGTTFRIYLPLAKMEVEEERGPDGAIAIGRGETILLAEDDAHVRKVTQITLEEYGYKVIEAENGEEAVKRFIENRDIIALLILDVIMPLKHGREVYDEIRAISPDIKAIFMSGYTDDIISRKGILSEGIEFISKPINTDILLKKVREGLDR